MEKGSKFNLLKLSSYFTSSCKTQNLDEVIDHHAINKNPIFTLQNPILLQAPLMEEEFNNEEYDEDEKYPFCNLFTKPKKQSYQPCSSSCSSSRLMCKPRCPETFDQMIRQNCIITAGGNPCLRRKVTGRYSVLSPSGDCSGRRCPPTSPASPLFSKQGKVKDKKKKGKQTNSRRNNNNNNNNNNNKLMKNGLKSNPFSFSSSSESDNDGYLFSSDGEIEDNEKENMFSSKSISLSSDSGDHQTQTRTQTRARPRIRPGRRKMGSRRKEVGVMPLEGKVKDTFAVVKSSSDPYNDFRTSMVEMIIEKQIFGAKELDQLLQCFLSLNSSHHHKVILEVFNEICDALFSHST